MFGNLGFSEIMILLMVFLLVFGARRLPEIGQSLGKGIKEFKRSLTDAGDAVTSGTTNDERSAPSRQLDAPTTPAPSSSEPKRLSQ
jgi:sec-independent protein translocase protein TatA